MKITYDKRIGQHGYCRLQFFCPLSPSWFLFLTMLTYQLSQLTILIYNVTHLQERGVKRSKEHFCSGMQKCTESTMSCTNMTQLNLCVWLSTLCYSIRDHVLNITWDFVFRVTYRKDIRHDWSTRLQVLQLFAIDYCCNNFITSLIMLIIPLISFALKRNVFQERNYVKHSVQLKFEWYRGISLRLHLVSPSYIWWYMMTHDGHWSDFL